MFHNLETKSPNTHAKFELVWFSGFLKKWLHGTHRFVDLLLGCVLFWHLFNFKTCIDGWNTIIMKYQGYSMSPCLYFGNQTQTPNYWLWIKVNFKVNFLKVPPIQRDPNKNLLIQMAITINISDPAVRLQFSAVCLQFSKINGGLQNTFWLYQHGVRNAYFQSYGHMNWQTLIWDTL